MGIWKVELRATDGRVCRWEFSMKKYSLRRVRDIVKGYIDGCPYDCKYEVWEA